MKCSAGWHRRGPRSSARYAYAHHRQLFSSLSSISTPPLSMVTLPNLMYLSLESLMDIDDALPRDREIMIGIHHVEHRRYPGICVTGRPMEVAANVVSAAVNTVAGCALAGPAATVEDKLSMVRAELKRSWIRCELSDLPKNCGRNAARGCRSQRLGRSSVRHQCLPRLEGAAIPASVGTSCARGACIA